MDVRKVLGLRGEDRAAAFLKKQGYRVLERNWSHRLGEIDIVAADRDVLVFVEVKTRHSLTHGAPEEAVNRRKEQKLLRLAEAYVRAARYEGHWRIDVVAIDENGTRLIKSAVDESVARFE